MHTRHVASGGSPDRVSSRNFIWGGKAHGRRVREGEGACGRGMCPPATLTHQAPHSGKYSLIIIIIGNILGVSKARPGKLSCLGGKLPLCSPPSMKLCMCQLYKTSNTGMQGVAMVCKSYVLCFWNNLEQTSYFILMLIIHYKSELHWCSKIKYTDECSVGTRGSRKSCAACMCQNIISAHILYVSWRVSSLWV
jgi:hypothetical protein